MSDEQNKTVENSENQLIRHTLVDTAVNFLLNPAVIDKPYAHKTAFLKKKGLSDAEISLAYKNAENDPKFKEFQGNELPKRSFLPPPVPVYRSVSFWSQLSRVSSSLIVLGVSLYGVHYVYKKYIEPLIFGTASESNKSLKLETQLLEITNSLSQLEQKFSTFEESIKSQKVQMDRYLLNEVNEYHPTPLVMKDLVTEVAFIKSLLLKRHQFPAVPKVNPSIPGWQLPPKKDVIDTAKEITEMNKHEDPNFSQDSSKSDTQLYQCDGDAAKQSGAAIDLENNVNIRLAQNQSSEELNESPVLETISDVSSIHKSFEKLNNFPIPETITNA